jgi:hypothetical protein
MATDDTAYTQFYNKLQDMKTTANSNNNSLTAVLAKIKTALSRYKEKDQQYEDLRKTLVNKMEEVRQLEKTVIEKDELIKQKNQIEEELRALHTKRLTDSLEVINEISGLISTTTGHITEINNAVGDIPPDSTASSPAPAASPPGSTASSPGSAASSTTYGGGKSVKRKKYKRNKLRKTQRKRHK